MRVLFLVLSLFLANISFANSQEVNVYTWANYLPTSVIQQFQKETGIKVNLATFDTNETLYAKLRSNPNIGYDVIMPSSYYIQRMLKSGLLHKLDHSKLPNRKHDNPQLLNKSFDPGNQYTYPYTWGATGIVYNDKYFKPGSINRWTDLWNKRFYNQLMMLNDVREVFSIGLLSLNLSPNNTNPADINKAYKQLLKLLPNVRLFNADAIITIYVDEDARIGMGWNGDIFKAMQENPHLQFVYPEDGFVVWIDTMAIAKNAPHLENAHRFMNFLMRPDIAKTIMLSTGFSTPNQEAIKLLPENIRNNPVINPDANTLKRGRFQTGIGAARAIYEKYWEMLKLAA